MYILLFPWCHRNKKIDGKLYKNILIHYIGYVTIEDSKYVKITSLNLLYLILNKVNGYFEEINKSKYLTHIRKLNLIQMINYL